MVGALPPPQTGQAISFERLLNQFVSEENVNVYPFDTCSSSKDKHITGALRFVRIFETLTLIFKFSWLFYKKKPNIVYMTKGSTTLGFCRDLCLQLVSRAFNSEIRFVVHLKGGNYDVFYSSSPKYIKYLIRFFLKKCNAIIVLGNSLIPMYHFLPEINNKIFVVNNALTTSYQLERSEFCKSGVVNFLYLSNLIYTKGYIHILEAAEILLRDNIKQFNLTFAGHFMKSPDDPEDIDGIQEIFQEGIKLYKNIKYIGPVGGIDKHNLLKYSDVFILPTNYYVEGQPVSIIEAMAYSMPVITTNYRSIPDIVCKENAKFVEYSNIEQIKDAMNYFIQNKKIIEEMGSQSRKLYQNKFTWETHFENIRKIILEIS